MKYNELKDKIPAWVEQNGVYPQKGGESIMNLCKHFGIDMETFRNWKENTEFSEAIKRANAVFQRNTCNDIVNSLKRRALGYKDIQVVSVGKKDGSEFKVDKIQRTEKEVPADVGAAIFLLVNMEPENWVNPMKIEQKTDITSGGKPIHISVVDEATRLEIEKIGNNEGIRQDAESVE